MHKVKLGENLWELSKEYYKDGQLWPLIYAANEHSIGTDFQIRPRQLISIYNRLNKSQVQDAQSLASRGLLYDVLITGKHSISGVALKASPN